MLTAQVAQGMLAFDVIPPPAAHDKTQGLLGIFNADQLDDLTPRDGQVLDEDATSSTIFRDFGVTCKWFTARL